MSYPGVFIKAMAILVLATLTNCVTMRITEQYFFHPMAYDSAGERVEVQGENGVVLVGRYLKHPNARATLVYYGGNTDFVDLNGKIMQQLSEPRLNVLMVDYRGYGASAGKPSLETFLPDSLAVYRYAQNRPDAKGLPLLAYGFSLGGYAAAHAAAMEPCSGLILEATGTNVKSWTKLVIPWYYKLFVRVRIDEKLKSIDNTEKTAKFSHPLLVLAGKADDQAPAAMSQKLFDVSPSANKNLHIFAVGKHGAIKDETDFKGVFSSFIDKALP